MPLVDVAALAVVLLAGAAIYAIVRSAARPGGAPMSAWVAVVCMVLAVLVVGGQIRAMSGEVFALSREVEALRETMTPRSDRDGSAPVSPSVIGSAVATPSLVRGGDTVDGEGLAADDEGTDGDSGDTPGGAFEPILSNEPRDAVDAAGQPAPSTWARLKDAFQGLEGPGHAARRGSVELGGAAGGSLPIRVFGQDLIEVRVFNHAGHELEALDGLALKVGSRKYPLLAAGGRYGEQRVRVPGEVRKEVATSLENPGKLAGVTIRLLARSVQPVRARRAFETLLGDAAYRLAAREHFRIASTDDLRLRDAPNLESDVHDKLDQGSYVLVVREADGWSEVETPDGQRGFIKGEFLTQIAP